jgi:serine phosphatase RsbU (regulator of sigma subunit)
VATALQRDLLPHSLPDWPGFDLATLYRPARGAADVGGDFFDLFEARDERMIVIGDVSGKGVEAAGVTAMVRYMAEALSQHCADPAELVNQLNDLLVHRMPDGSLVTLALVVVDTTRDELAWCVAGHPPPVILSLDGAYRRLDDPDPPCGVFPGQEFREGVERFGPGDVMVLYTDGLIEARRLGREFGEDALREVLVAGVRDAPGDLARGAYAAARAWCGGLLGDDVAIAVLRRAPVAAPV